LAQNDIGANTVVYCWFDDRRQTKNGPHLRAILHAIKRAATRYSGVIFEVFLPFAATTISGIELMHCIRKG
jgi:hypothetical protein